MTTQQAIGALVLLGLASLVVSCAAIWLPLGGVAFALSALTIAYALARSDRT